jgi:tetratricopeptide (TPR) repeat protein
MVLLGIGDQQKADTSSREGGGGERMSGIDPVTSEEDLPSAPANNVVNNNNNNGHLDGGGGDDRDDDLRGQSLIIPITTSVHGGGGGGGAGGKGGNSPALFIEIFPEEMPAIRPATVSGVLRDERAPLRTWCDASLLYMRVGRREKEGCELLNSAVDDDAVMSGSNTADRLRVLASAGIAALAQANRQVGDIGRGGAGGGAGGGGGGGSSSSSAPHPPQGGVAGTGASMLDDLLESAKAAEMRDADQREELRALADARFAKADNINQVNPMTWVGRGMLNLAQNKLDQARFFFENLTLRECGETLPALIGMAAVKFLERDYAGALDLYGRAMRRYPRESGSATRVGFGMACYRLGQIDRAKASFRRAHELDPENVEAMMGMAVLELGSLDPDVLSPREYRSRAEGVIKMISMANLADHTNAMVQNQLSSYTYYYFGFRSFKRVSQPKSLNVLFVKKGTVIPVISDVMIIACQVTFSIGVPETIHFNTLSFSGVILFVSSSFFVNANHVYLVVISSVWPITTSGSGRRCPVW